MNPIRALIATGVACVVLAVCGYLVYDNRDFLFGETYNPEIIAPAPVPEVVEVTEAASAAASSASTATATATATAAPAPLPAPVASAAKAAATPAATPASAASAPATKPVVAKPSAPVSAPTSAPVSVPKSVVEPAKTAPTPSVEVAKPVTAPETKPAPERAKEIQLIIKEIKFTGVTQVPEKELYKAVGEFIGKELTVDQAFAIPAKVTNYYKRNNLMAIATLSGAMTPDGVLTIGVVEMQMTQIQAEKELATLAPQAAPAPASAPTVLPMRASTTTTTSTTTAAAQPQPQPQPQPQAQAQTQAQTPVTATAPAVSTVAPVTASTSTSTSIPASAPPKSTPSVDTKSAVSANEKPPLPSPATAASPQTAPPTTKPIAATTSTPVPMPAAPRPGAVSALTYTPAARTPLPTSKDTDSETDYILKNYAKKSRQYELMVDNYGPDATGSARVGAALAIGGDQFSLVGFKSSGSDYLRMAVNWITGIDGLKVGAHVASLKYDVVNHLQTAMYQSGDAVKRGVSLIYELVNETSHYSTLALKLDNKSANAVGLNLADSTAYKSWVSNLEYKGIVREMIPGGAVFTYELSYAQGHVDINGASNIGGIEVDEGPFSKLRFSSSVTQPLDGLGSVFAGLSMQRSRNNLDPSERFYLGGPNGVRAYGVGEGYGSEGELATLEFRQRLSASTTIAEFYDWGRARLTHDRAAANNNTSLSGYGVSIAQEIGKDTTIKGTWARSHGKNTPLPTSPNGSDNVDRNRFWLSMETRF